jgi:hypothetical protein
MLPLKRLSVATKAQTKAETCPESHSKARFQFLPSAPTHALMCLRGSGGNRRPPGPSRTCLKPWRGERGTEPSAASYGKKVETNSAAESQGNSRLPGHNGFCLSLPTCKIGLITSLPPGQTSEGAGRVNCCLQPWSPDERCRKWALVTGQVITLDRAGKVRGLSGL